MKKRSLLSQSAFTTLKTAASQKINRLYDGSDAGSKALHCFFAKKTMLGIIIALSTLSIVGANPPEARNEYTKSTPPNEQKTVAWSPLTEKPLIELNFEAYIGSRPHNTGTALSSDFIKSSSIPQIVLDNLPPTKVGISLDFGTSPGNYFVESVEVIDDLKNLDSFTIMGWLNCKNNRTGSGGNRIVSWINNGGDGVDLVYKSNGSLQLGVNGWPDNSPAISSPGKVPTDGLASSGNWVFFAVTYNSTIGQVQFYFGKEGNAALDVTKTYHRGAVGSNIGKLAIGHFNDATRPRALDRMFRGLIDNIQIYGKALSVTDIVAIQNISGAPDTEAPTPPVLTVDAKTNTSVTLSWASADDNLDLHSYTLFSGTERIGFFNSALSRYNLTGLTPNTEYTFTIKVMDNASNISSSNTVTVTTDNTPLTSTNTKNGYQSLGSNTTGYNNTASGYNALFNNAEGSANTATGADALFSNLHSRNNAYGYAALRFNTEGDGNNAFGVEALFSTTAGNANSAFGNRAMFSNTHGFNNVAVGHEALYFNTQGSHNTAIGPHTLASNTIGNYNTAIGFGAGSGLNNLQNSTAIGHGAKITASNQVRIGNSDVTSIGGPVSWSTISDGRFKRDIREDISGLEFISNLRPVSYSLDQQQVNKFLGTTNDTQRISTDDSRKKVLRQSGFVAQEVEALIKKTGYVFHGLEVPQNESDHYSIRYAEFVVPLVKAVQELNVIVQEQKREIIELQNQLLKPVNEDRDANIDAELYQNNPNPSSGDTEIGMKVPEGFLQVKIIIYNLEGKQLNAYTVHDRGNVKLKINGNELQPGMYLYSLVIDGKVIDTKRMILTN
jgi:trimeric autotransporter adhesin